MLGRTLDAAGQIDRVPKRPVFEFASRPDVAYLGHSRMNANRKLGFDCELIFPTSIQWAESDLHIECRLASSPGLIGLLDRRAPHGDDRVADVIDDSTVVHYHAS